MTLHTLDGDLNGGHNVEQWEKILEALKSGEMPPEDEPQPKAEDRLAVASWIESGLRRYIEANQKVEPVATTRRLTNFEYQNTMRDLFGFELKLSDKLPVDPVKAYRFNNTADFMLLGPEQLDRYRECAQRVLASAIVAAEKPEVHRTKVDFKSDRPAESGVQPDEVIPGAENKSLRLKSWPQTGEFRMQFTASAILPAGIHEMPLRLVMGYNLDENSSMFQMEPVGTVTLKNNLDHPQTFELRGRIENFPVRPGINLERRGVQPPTMTVTLQNLYSNGRPNDNLRGIEYSLPRAVVSSVEFEAPVLDVWPPEHHTRILFPSPLRESDPVAYVREVLARFLPRAFRRPVAAAEIALFADHYQQTAATFSSFEEAMRDTLSLVLVSPQFLYHTDTAADGTPTRHYELAAKLSYFLWGSMPDDELMSLSAQARLRDPVVVQQQVLRMLADRRSEAFVENFTSQWLGTHKVKGVSINRDLFPRFLALVINGERAGTEVPYRPTIRDYMCQETAGFFAELIRQNASVLNLVDSNFAYLNEPLAQHYGVPGVEGLALRPVAIKPEYHLGGLLTQGAILVGNSTGSAPHPIYRAVWLREAILGDDVKPPPAEVPALSDSAGKAADNATSIAEMLRQHRKVESCSDCHVRLDPWGIPFEEYNSIGRYQPLVPKNGVRLRGFNLEQDKDLAGYEAYLKTVNTVKLEATSRVPSGPEVNGVAELKAYLLREKRTEIVTNVIRRLLTYGIGRPLTFRDRFTVESLLQQAQTNDYKLRDLIVAICQSKTFQGNPVKSSASPNP